MKKLPIIIFMFFIICSLYPNSFTIYSRNRASCTTLEYPNKKLPSKWWYN